MWAASILWKRLDGAGHDACRLDGDPAGWALRGTAVFRQEGAPARLTYLVACDLEWRSLRGEVEGWIGARPIVHSVERTSADAWTLDGRTVASLERCVDLDLGFTPATNLVALRRLGLAEGDSVEAPAAWLDASKGTLSALAQRYERLSSTTYWYEAPGVPYAGVLDVAPNGFVLRYPGLWEVDP